MNFAVAKATLATTLAQNASLNAIDAKAKCLCDAHIPAQNMKDVMTNLRNQRKRALQFEAENAQFGEIVLSFKKKSEELENDNGKLHTEIDVLKKKLAEKNKEVCCSY